MTLTHHKDYPGFNFMIHIYDSQRLYQVFCPRLGHCLLSLSFFWLKWGVFPRSFRYRTRMCIWDSNTSINVNCSQIVKIYYNLDRVNIISDPFLDLKKSRYLLTAQGQVVAVYWCRSGEIALASRGLRSANHRSETRDLLKIR